MAEKPKIIKRLEKKIGKRLEKVKLSDIGNVNSYASDERRNIIGLNLDKTKMSDVSPLRELTSLTELYLFENQITDVSPLRELTALNSLNLSFNQINDVSPLLNLKNLRRLNLSANHISQLPREFLQLDLEIKWKDDSRHGIFLTGNPMEIPPVEIVKQGTAAVRNYFTQLEKAQVRLMHAKLLIVGNGEVGKTTLMKKLKDNHFQVELGKEQTTHGINIVPWKLNCTFATGDTAPVARYL